jgi:peptidoglycan/LPS O-acetylase OafA/YrhL
MTLLPSLLGFPHSFFALVLNAKPLVYLSRISFCTYLVHLFVVYYFLGDRVYDLYYNLIDVFTVYCGLLVLSLFFGFLLTMLVEVPFATLLKVGVSNYRNANKSAPKESLITTESIVMWKQDRDERWLYEG